MRTSPRPRRPLPPALLAVLRPALRYSYTREAYVLRGVGTHRGPVFVRTAPADVARAPDDGDRAAVPPDGGNGIGA